MTDRLSARPRSAAAVPFLGALGVALCLSVVPARASVFYDVTLDMGLGDDARVFLNVANDYFAPPPAVAVDLVRRCPSPVDDYPVILLMARASRRSPVEILRMRLDYLTWSDIMFRLHISPDILFVGLDRDPGPPYGRAWGHWRKHRRGDHFRFRDRDVIELTKLRVASGYQHVNPYSIVAERNRGLTVEQYVANRNRGKYSKGGPARGEPRGKEHGKPKGQDRPKGHGKPHDHD